MALVLAPVVPTTLLSVSASADAEEGKGGTDEYAGTVVYMERRTIASDGTLRLTSEGSSIVSLADGGEFVVGLNSLKSPDGRRFSVVGDVYQDDPDADVVYELRIVENTPHFRTEDELVESWAMANSDASADDALLFRQRRQRNAELTVPSVEIDAMVQDWVATASESANISVWIKLVDQPTLDLPVVEAGMLLESDPAFVLDQMEDRLIAIEARKTEVEELQSELIAELEGMGARVDACLWTVNAFRATVDAASIRTLGDHPAVARIELDGGDLNEAANHGEEIRVASQLKPYLDGELDGELGSGRTSVEDIYIAIIDDKLDIDHPAWDDCDVYPCVSRLLRQEEWNGSAWVADAVGGTGGAEHGNWVAGQLMADLTEGQDAAIHSSAARKARTGMTTESSLVALHKGGAGSIELALDRAVELNVDILNLSAGCANCLPCDLTHMRNDLVNVAFLEGVFFSKGAGNDGHDGSDCRVIPPSTAAGAFVVGGYSHTATDLNSGGVFRLGSRGGDGVGRAIVDLAAAAGRSAGGLPEFDNSYTAVDYAGTSLATPVVAGAAANLKHRLIEGWGSAVANTVGLLHVHLLLMGDGQLEGGGFATASTPVDTVWGAGRLRARMWNSQGLDAPYRARWMVTSVEDAEVVSLKANPNGAGTNLQIPAAADRLKAAVWWYEPNANDPIGEVAELQTRICDEDSSTCYVHSSSAPDAHRLLLGSVAQEKRWRLDVTGVNVPVNLGPDVHFGEQERSVFIALYWEDLARDDADGPDSSIQ